MGEQENMTVLYDKIQQIQASIMDLSDTVFVIAQGLYALYGKSDDVAQSCLSVIQLELETIASEKIAELQQAASILMQE